MIAFLLKRVLKTVLSTDPLVSRFLTGCLNVPTVPLKTAVPWDSSASSCIRKLIHWEEVRDLCWAAGYTTPSKAFIFSKQGSPLRIAFIPHSLWSLISLTYNPSFSPWRKTKPSFYPTLLSSCSVVTFRRCWSVRRDHQPHIFSQDLDAEMSSIYRECLPRLHCGIKALCVHLFLELNEVVGLYSYLFLPWHGN